MWSSCTVLIAGRPFGIGRLLRVYRNVMSEPLACADPVHQVNSKPKILVIAGNTAVGKTDLSLHLASLLNGEVVSADSAQVFRRLDIGSAKVTEREAASVKHHLLDVADIDRKETFSVADYCELAKTAIEDILSRGRVPLVVGGTGLYILTLLQGGATGSPQSTVETKAMVDRLVEEEDGGDWEKSMSRLEALDPVYAASLHPNDHYRLKRALEICLLSGNTVTSYKKELSIEDCPYNAKCLFLTMPRVELFQRIDTRCEAIIDNGLIQEVVALVKEGRLVLDSQAGRCIGYRQVLEYLQDVWGFPQEGVASTRQEGGASTPQVGVASNAGKLYSLKIPRENLKKSFYEFLFVYKSRTRQLAQMQLVRFKKSPWFQWLNMSPRGSKRLSTDRVSAAVSSWFNHGTPLPEEWDGTKLLTLTPSENRTMREYSFTHCKPQIFVDEQKVASLMESIEECLKS